MCTIAHTYPVSPYSMNHPMLGEFSHCTGSDALVTCMWESKRIGAACATLLSGAPRCPNFSALARTHLVASANPELFFPVNKFSLVERASHVQRRLFWTAEQCLVNLQRFYACVVLCCAARARCAETVE
jgi:hypothetical protein